MAGKRRDGDDQAGSILLAGGVLASGTKLSADLAERVDSVDARALTHPALGDRVVVRLTPAALAPGEDVVLEYLGFDTKGTRTTRAVGLQIRRSLGFPDWALVHDPKRARFALEVMKDFRKEAKRAKSKPGHAKEGFDTIAKRLGRSVPHFLPSFYEEAGRVFIDAGSATYAAQCFGKAREVEKTHRLSIDEDARKTSFLEFALAGAVTIKALTAYAKDLEESVGPGEAYRIFREVAVRRTLGGLPPWASMAKDLQRLARLAPGLDAALEDENLLEEILGASAVARAPLAFWEAYAPALGRLVPRSRGAREAFLRLSPEPSGAEYGDKAGEALDRWLGLAEECGASKPWLDRPAGKGAKVAKEERSQAALWFGRMLDRSSSWRSPVSDSVYSLLRRLAEHMKADGTPVRFWIEDRWGGRTLEVDLADLALELGVPVADPPDGIEVELDRWARWPEGSKERPRDPTRIASEPRFAEALRKGVEGVNGRFVFEKAASGKSAFLEARRRFFLGLCDPREGALPGLRLAVEILHSQTTADTFREFPEAFQKLEKAGRPLADRLGTSLRGGIAKELAWPAFEAAVRDLTPPKDEGVKSCGAFPFLALSDGKAAIVIGPKGRVLEHDLRLPKGSELVWLQFVDGELLVVFRDRTWHSRAYWSGSPKKAFEPKTQGWFSLGAAGIQLPLPGGGVHLGGGPLRVGDTEIPATSSDVLCDGTTWWRRGEKETLDEFDPLSGRKGRSSLPRFLEDYVKEGWSLDIPRSSLLPAPEGLSSSPLGLRDGLLGWRVRTRNQPAEVEAEGVDGRRFAGPLLDGHPCQALVSLPGLRRPVPAAWSGGPATFFDPERMFELSNAREGDASCLGLPWIWWHLFVPRDPKGSAALRSVKEKLAKDLLEAALEDVPPAPEIEDDDDDYDDEDVTPREFPKAAASVKKLLPAIGDDALRRGVAAMAGDAARVARRHEDLVRRRNPETAEVEEEVEAKTWGGACLPQLHYIFEGAGYLSLDDMVGQMRATARFFETGKPAKLWDSDAAWPDLIGRQGSLAYFALAPGTSAEERELILRFIEAWLETPFVEPEAGKLRLVSCKIKSKKIPFPLQKQSYLARALGEHEGNRYLVKEADVDEDEQDEVPVLEFAPTGKFKLLPGAKIDGDEIRFDAGWATREKLTALIETIRTRGPLVWDRALAESLASGTGMSYAEAALLLMGFPRFDEYGKNFLPAETREQIGIKAKEAEAARQSLRSLYGKKLRDVLDAAMPADPTTIHDDPAGFVAGLAASYSKAMGRRVAIDPEILAQADRDLSFTFQRPAQVLENFRDPKGSAELNEDGKWRFDLNGVSPEGERKADAAFGPGTLTWLPAYFFYLASELPVGHPILASLPEVHARASKRLAHPGLLVEGPTFQGKPKDCVAFVEGLGGKPYHPEMGWFQGKVTGRDGGALLAATGADLEEAPTAFRPAKVKDWSFLRQLAGGEGDSRGDLTRAVEALLSAGAKDIAQRARKTPVPEGAYEANPLHSAPQVVKEVAKKRKLGEDAAVLYLQLLTLAVPTDQRIQVYNGWDATRLKRAGDELKKAKLVLEAKRSRAGRSLFLPGGWEELKAPNLPVETWKFPLYDVERDRKTQKAVIPLERILPLEPLHQLFAKAWGRVAKGDEPGYEEAR